MLLAKARRSSLGFPAHTSFGMQTSQTMVGYPEQLRRRGSMATRIWRDEVMRLVRDEAAQLVEVLPPPEFEDEHVEGAISIPLKNLDREADERLDRQRPVIVY